MPDENDIALLEELASGCAKLREQAGRVVVGQAAVVHDLLAAILAEGHALLIGVPGLAKTLMVRVLAEAIGGQFKRIQFTPDMMPADIIGTELLEHDASGARAWRFSEGPVFANLVLADEINRTPPKTQAALLEAMQERQVTSLGITHRLPRPFVVIATQNPIEQEGTYPLPEAQLDRFLMCLNVAYPEPEDEVRIVSETTAPRDETIAPVFAMEKLLAYQALVRRMPAAPSVVRYAVNLCRATRPADPLADETVRRLVEWGAGPRGGQCLILAGKAHAAMAGRPTVTCEDVRRVAPAVLRHRVLPNFTAAAEGIAVDTVIDNVLERVRVDAH